MKIPVDLYEESPPLKAESGFKYISICSSEPNIFSKEGLFAADTGDQLHILISI
jgi:hypothetical protein